VLKFGPTIARRLRRRRPRPSDRWHLDEMVIRIAGVRMYLWRAVDHEGEVLDMLVQRRREYSLTMPAAPAEAATAETSAEAGVRKAEATKAGVEETGVSKAGVDEAKAVEPWAKEGTSETAVPTAAECDGSSGGPSPAPRPAPSPRITSPIPIIRVGIPIGVRWRHLRFRRKRHCLGEHG
jgi:DDE domain